MSQLISFIYSGANWIIARERNVSTPECWCLRIPTMIETVMRRNGDTRRKLIVYPLATAINDISKQNIIDKFFIEFENDIEREKQTDNLMFSASLIGNGLRRKERLWFFALQYLLAYVYTRYSHLYLKYLCSYSYQLKL